MQPEQNPITDQVPQPPSTEQNPAFNPPQGLPLQPPSNLPQADYTGYTGLIAYLNTPKGIKVGTTVIVLSAMLIILILSAFGVISLG